jgi:hypothetical protein
MKPQSLNLMLEASRPAGPVTSGATQSLERLTAALEHEIVAVRELGEALVQQRSAVASSDIAAVNASVDDVGRLLLAVDESRRHRVAVVAELGGDPGVSLEKFEPPPGTQGAGSYAAARAALRREAEKAAHEAAVNRTVLRSAVEAGNAFLQALFSSADDPAPVYRAAEHQAPPRSPGFILNRRA